MERGQLVVKVLVIGTILVQAASSSWSAYLQYGDHGAPAVALRSLRGREFVWDGQVRPLLTTDSARWRRVVVNGDSVLFVRRMTGPSEPFWIDHDAADRTVTLASPRVKAIRTVAFPRPDVAHLSLEGKLRDSLLTVRLRKIDESSFPLVTRGFRWITESPFNR